jgi:hypothetical protein
MLVNQTERVYSIEPNSMSITVYDDTLDTDTGKHVLNTYVYTIELYSSKGIVQHYSNSHSIDLYA